MLGFYLSDVPVGDLIKHCIGNISMIHQVVSNKDNVLVVLSYAKTTRAKPADSIYDLLSRKINKAFFTQVLLDLRSISKMISDIIGNPSYDSLLLFRMCLLQTWHGSGDYQVVNRVNDSIFFGYSVAY